jgi:hypothetical protein
VHEVEPQEKSDKQDEIHGSQHDRSLGAIYFAGLERDNLAHDGDKPGVNHRSDDALGLDVGHDGPEELDDDEQVEDDVDSGVDDTDSVLVPEQFEGLSRLYERRDEIDDTDEKDYDEEEVSLT